MIWGWRFRIIKYLAPALPYVAVLIGLGILQNAWAAIFIYHLFVVITLFLACKGSWLRQIDAGAKPSALWVYILACALAGPAVYLLWPFMKIDQATLDDLLEMHGLSGSSWFLFIAYFSLVHPIIEELFWRWFLEPGRRSITWQDIAFGGYHILVLVLFLKPPWLVPAFMVLIFVSWAWRQAAIRHNGLAIPVISHTIACFSVVAAAQLLR